MQSVPGRYALVVGLNHYPDLKEAREIQKCGTPGCEASRKLCFSEEEKSATFAAFAKHKEQRSRPGSRIFTGLNFRVGIFLRKDDKWQKYQKKCRSL
jgi:hypothetical protein